MALTNPLVSNKYCVANIPPSVETLESSTYYVNRFSINAPVKNSLKEEVRTKAFKHKTTPSLMKKITQLAFLLGLSLIVAGISVSVLMPVLISISIPLVILGLGVLFFSIIYALNQYVKKSHDQIKNTEIEEITIEEISKENRVSEEIIIEENRTREEIIIDDIQEEDINIDKKKKEALMEELKINTQDEYIRLNERTQERLIAANKIRLLYKVRNRRILAKKENEFGIVKLTSPFYVNTSETGVDQEKIGFGNKIFSNEKTHYYYSDKKTYRKFNDVELERLYFKYSKSTVNNKSSGYKLKFIGVVPNENINGKYLKYDPKVFMGKMTEGGAYKSVDKYDNKYITLKTKVDDKNIDNYFINITLAPYKSIVPLTKYGSMPGFLSGRYTKLISPYKDETLDVLIDSEQIALSAFESALLDIKKMYENNIYVSDIKMNNMVVERINRVNNVFLIDADSIFSKSGAGGEFTHNYYYYPRCLVTKYEDALASINNHESDLSCDVSDYWKILLNMQTYALLQVLFDASRRKEKDESDILSNNIDNIKHSDDYIKTFNVWVDAHVLPAKREEVKKFILDPMNNPINSHAYDLIDFDTDKSPIRFYKK